MIARLAAAGLLFAIVIATPALAGSTPSVSIPVPEPADMALFAAGVIGLVIGRRTSRNRRKRED